MNTRGNDGEVPTVLIVDDEEDMVDLLARHLPDGYEKLQATRGEEALELLDPTVDVVLLDRRMPGMSGDEVLEEIRDREVDVRVVMITAVEPDLDLAEMSFDTYLVKPVDEEDTRSAVEQLLRRKEHDRSLQDLVAFVAKMKTLEDQFGPEELRQSDEYETLRREFSELQREIDELESDDDLYSDMTLGKLKAVFESHNL